MAIAIALPYSCLQDGNAMFGLSKVEPPCILWGKSLQKPRLLIAGSKHNMEPSSSAVVGIKLISNISNNKITCTRMIKNKKVRTFQFTKPRNGKIHYHKSILNSPELHTFNPAKSTYTSGSHITN